MSEHRASEDEIVEAHRAGRYHRTTDQLAPEIEDMPSRKMLRLTAIASLVVLGTLIAVAATHLVEKKPGYTEYLERVGKADKIVFKDASIPPAMMLSGKAVCRSKLFHLSHDRSAESGIWECQGPAKFNYYYGMDESVYILAGTAEIEYLGKKFVLSAGDTTHFVQGTTATWAVPEHVRKTFTFHTPGRVVRYMRMVLR
jgi:uncharacterized cupin superfamily protein